MKVEWSAIKRKKPRYTERTLGYKKKKEKKRKEKKRRRKKERENLVLLN